jgi:hypothetical protein
MLGQDKMEDDATHHRKRALAAIRRSARVAMSRGIAVIPLRASREHLAVMFEDPREQARVIAAYDHLEDVIVFNADYPAWSDMPTFMKDRKERGFYSTAHPHHIVRHELGHAVHYRALTPRERERIWFAESLRPGEEPIARKVSIRAILNPKEFVAEVFAGLWSGVDYDDDVIALFEDYGGQRP